MVTAVSITLEGDTEKNHHEEKVSKETFNNAKRNLSIDTRVGVGIYCGY